LPAQVAVPRWEEHGWGFATACAGITTSFTSAQRAALNYGYNATVSSRNVCPSAAPSTTGHENWALGVSDAARHAPLRPPMDGST